MARVTRSQLEDELQREKDINKKLQGLLDHFKKQARLNCDIAENNHARWKELSKEIEKRDAFKAKLKRDIERNAEHNANFFAGIRDRMK